MSLFWKLIALVAVLLMPLGMAGAPAHAQPHQAMAGMTMGHCPDQGARHDMTGGFADCTMACAAALPAVELPEDFVEPATVFPARPGLAARLYGLHPETAKPPPRIA